MTRRAQGEGGLRFRKWDGRYEARTQYTDAFGRRRPRSFYGHTKQEALSARDRFRDSLVGGRLPNPDKLTLETYLKFWLDPETGGVRDHVRPHVIPDYERAARLNIIPLLGTLTLAEITTANVQAMADKLLKQKYAPTSVRRVHAVLQSALGDAKRAGIINSNPCNGVRIVDRRRLSWNYWEPEQVRTFLTTARGDYYEAYFVLSLTTGLRIGEALGLRWSDLDLDRGTMRIEQQLLQKRPEGRLTPDIFGDVKRPASHRDVNLSKLAVTALRAHHARQAELALNLGEPWRTAAGVSYDLVFVSPFGLPLYQQTVTRAFQAVTTRAKLPRLKVHEMRHTAAALMIFSGEDVLVVSKTLGHASVNITLNIYGHLFKAQRRHLADSMDRLLGNNS
jgi:integrase